MFEFCVQVLFEHSAPKCMKVFMLSVFCCSDLSKIEMRPHAAQHGSFLTTFRDCLTLEEGTDRISLNVRTKLQFRAA